MRRPVALITGGAGFIGSNAAERWIEKGWEVRILDDLSRPGSERNAGRLVRLGARLTKADIRDRGAVARWVRQAGARTRLVIHLAGQTAVTTSVADPRGDFETNAGGSLNLLEAVRPLRPRPLTIYASTNKVYGAMEDLAVRRAGERYRFASLPHGIPEERPLDFHSPYGCSKGAADQYFRDYHRIYGLPTVVFRQSCAYGRLQLGNEDQGWVAHLMASVLRGGGVTLYGDGRQARDVLYGSDLIDAYEAAYARRARAAGEVFNLGGGPRNVLSLRELVAWLEQKAGRRVPVRRARWRPGDQRVFVSDVRKASRLLGWRPRVGVKAGLDALWDWLASSL